jgi:hypothetical protein
MRCDHIRELKTSCLRAGGFLLLFACRSWNLGEQREDPLARARTKPYHRIFTRKASWLWVASLLALALLLINYSYLPVRHVMLHDPLDGTLKPVRLYYQSAETSTGTHYIFRGEIHRRALVPAGAYVRLRITQDDCLERLAINGREVPIPQAQQCTIISPLTLDVSGYLTQPVNQFEAVVQNKLLGANFNLVASYPCLAAMAKTLGFVVSLWAFWQGLLALKLAPGLRLATLVVMAAGYLYLLWTRFDVRVLDIQGHVDYVISILRFHTLPDPFSNMQSHHPFLYYLSAALVYAGLERVSQIPFYPYLQAFSFGWFIFYIVMQARLVALIISKPFQPHAMLLAGMVPELIFSGASVGNGMMCLAMNMAAFFHLVRWHQKERSQDFLAACGFTALGVLTRTSSVIFIGAILLVLAGRKYNVPRQPFFPRKDAWKAWGMLAVAILSLTATVADNYLFSEKRQEQPIFISNGMRIGQLYPHTLVKNDVRSYLFFDVADHLRRPVINFVEEGKGPRAYYWNDLLKSALVSEWLFFQPPLRLVPELFMSVRAMALLQILIILLFFIGLSSLKTRKSTLRNLPLAAVFLTALGASMGFRMVYPLIGNGDARYILFCGVPLAFFCMESRHALAMYLGRAKAEGVVRGLCLGWVLSVLVFLVFLWLSEHGPALQPGPL